MRTVLLFFGLIVVFIMAAMESDAIALPDNGGANDTEIHIRKKRLGPLGPAVLAAIRGLATTLGFAALSSPPSRTCNIGISTDEADGKLRMNFVSDNAEENCNTEILGGRDTTKERVDGGRLQYITVEILGHACLEYFALECGEDVTGRERRSILLSHESFPSYHCMMHKKWKEDPCVWIHDTNNDNIRKFFINKDIFNCEEKDFACHRNHIGTQIGGCVDMTQCKFCNDRCK